MDDLKENPEPMKKKEYTPPEIETFVVKIHPVLAAAAFGPGKI